MPDLIRRWLALDWHDPLVVALVAAILVVALWRRWGIVLLAALVVAMGQGLDYLLRHASFASGLSSGFVTAVYAAGGLLVLFLVAARVFGKR
ncbi:MAG TPA: hypothetical protein VLT84_10605 [Acidobacteriota bacterium]|nr:hypothetical protein [Acidobacteriota bacterium]